MRMSRHGRRPGDASTRKLRLWRPSTWAGLTPNGLGRQKPNHYADMVKIVWENRRNLPYAGKILAKGVCDGCALGVAGMHDWTIDGVHLCTTRLRLLAVNTAGPLDHDLLCRPAALRGRTGAELRALGRLGHPMRWRSGAAGYERVGWDEALDLLASGLRTAGGDRSALFVTSRGITNEVYYAAGKAARALGIASVDSAARTCHSPSTVALKDAIGLAATTCSFVDVLETDLVVLVGANPAANQPVFMKYLYEAKRDGAKVVVVNPYLEPGLEHYWVPSSPESAVFGTKMCDLHVPVRQGGDVAFCNAVLKVLVERGQVDRAFLDAHTEGWPEVEAAVVAADMGALCRQAGLSEAQVREFADVYAGARSAIVVWSMGITQHRESVEGVQAVVNLGLARGNVGRDGAGLMPIRGHSGVQGGAEMGCYATALPGGLSLTPENVAALEETWGFPVPPAPGLTAVEMVEAAERDELDVLWVSGSNFLDVLPDPARVERALGHVGLRVHQDIVLTSQMLVPPAGGGDVLMLPVRTRYEQEGGGTETTTERRVAFSPEIPGHVIGEAMSEWRLFQEVARRARPDLAGAAFGWTSNQALRAEIAAVVPAYEGIQRLTKTGDAIQWGGRHLAQGGVFPRPGGKALLRPTSVPYDDLPPGTFRATTRRGKQFNSMVFSDKDPLNGAHREDVLVDERDAAGVGLADGDRIVVRSAHGTMPGRVRCTPMAAGTVQVHFPEANVLLPTGPDHREPHSQVPDYTTLVTLEKA